MKLKKPLLCFLLSLLAVTGAHSQGTTGFETLRAEIGSRGSALAGAMIAMDSGIEGLFYNPAALGEIEDHQVRGTYHNHILDIEAGFFAYGQRIRNWGSLAFGLDYMNYGKFDVYNTNGVKLDESFRPNDLLFTLGYGRKFGTLFSAGLNLKYIHSEIYNVSSSAAAFDIGGIVYLPYRDFKIGFGIFNIGKTLDAFYEYEDKLPLSYKIGVSKPLEHLPMVLTLQADKFRDSDIYFSAGGEFTLSEMFRIRLGWSSRGIEQRMNADSDIFAGFSFGLGFIAGGVHIDYSLVSMGELGTQSRYSVGVNF